MEKAHNLHTSSERATQGVVPIAWNRLRQLARYDPETGFWTALQDINKRKAGSRLEAKGGPGYLAIWLEGRQYSAHRLAWFYMTGQWPIGIDHRNRNQFDNKWSNLRIANQLQNNGNQKLRKNNTSGIRGVTWDKTRKRWKAQIKRNYKNKLLGRYRTKEAAAKAYKVAAMQHFGEFYND